ASADRDKLTEQVSLALVDDAHSWTQDGLCIYAGANPPATTAALDLCISLTPAEHTQLENRLLRLAGVETGQVGVARLTAQALLYSGVHPLPLDTAPDATIAGTVEFVEDEARY